MRQLAVSCRTSRTSVRLGQLYDSQDRLAKNPSTVPSNQEIVVPSSPEEVLHFLEQRGYGVSETAAALINAPAFWASGNLPTAMTVSRHPLSGLGFTARIRYEEAFSQVMEKERVLPAPAAVALLAVLDGGEVGDGFYVLMKPIVLNGLGHLFYVAGNGPTLYAFPIGLGESFPPDTEFVCRAA